MNELRAKAGAAAPDFTASAEALVTRKRRLAADEELSAERRQHTL